MSPSARALSANMPSLAGARRAFTLVVRFLGGQTVVQCVNLVNGLLLVHWLPVGEYALYTLANVLLSVGAVGSDLGLSQAFVTFGARVREDRAGLGRWFGAVMRDRRLLYVPVVVVIVAVAVLTMRGHDWPPGSQAACVALALVCVWVQQGLALRQAVLNIHGDADGIFQSGLGSALARLGLILSVCREWPNAVTALVVSLVSFGIADALSRARARRYMVEPTAVAAADRARLRAFVRPLAPSVIYAAMEGQVTTMLVSVAGGTRSVAELGALGRLGQIVAFLMTVNLFVVHPHFARIERKGEFVAKTAWLGIALAFGGVLVVGTGVLLPGGWLWLLGGQYRELDAVLPLALATAWIVVARAAVHSLLMSRAATRGQVWSVALGIAIHVLVLATLGVGTTENAMILNLTLAVGGLVLQGALLGRVLRAWK